MEETRADQRADRPAVPTDPRDTERVSQKRRYVPGTGWRSKVPRYASIVIYVISALSIITALVPWIRRRDDLLRTWSEIIALPVIPYLTWGVLLLIVGNGLYRRKRVAWVALVTLETLQIVVLLVLLVAVGLARVAELENLDFPWEAILALAFSVATVTILTLARREFYAITPKGNGWRALGALVVGSIITIGVTFLLTTILPGTLESQERIEFAIRELFAPVGFEPIAPVSGAPPRIIIFVTGVLGAATLLAAAYFLFRPQRSKVMLSAPDEVAIRGLLREYGDSDSLGYFATRRDKSAVFSPSGKAAVTYRVINGVSLASADPVGDPEAWPAAIETWLEEARHHGWTAAVMGASKEGAEAYHRAGLIALHLGDEAVLEFHDFNLEGRESRVVRQAVSRVERSGYTAKVRRHADVPDDEMMQVVEFCDRTRDTSNERGFSMALGRLADPSDGNCVLVEAYDADGVLQGVLSFSPWGKRGISLDMMRRARGAENGVVEFMVTELVAAGPKLGLDRASLNFAVLREVFEEGSEIGAGPVLRASRAVLMFASRWYQLESLYRANAKYNPEWVPRYLLFDAARDLAKVSLAAGIAEGFVPEFNPKAVFRARGAQGSPLLAGAKGAPLALIAADEERWAAEQAEKAASESPLARLPEQERVRREKLAALVERGKDPFTAEFHPTDEIAKIREEFGDLPPDTRTGRTVAISGRLMRNRVSGKLVFGELKDFTGEIQVMLSLGEVGDESLAEWKHLVDLGDQLGVTGEVITSRRGELSVLVSSWVMTSKCLVPLPDKHKGLTDPEARVRQRYVDLIVNDEARQMLELRSRVVRSVRESLWRRGFVEVETPMLQPIHGGANARPFITHINAYDMRLYMRIAPELYLKKLLVGGAPKVFEMNRNFRNEGADATHNPEFTSMEMYDAYGDYDTMRVLTRDLIIEAAIAAWGRPVIRRPLPDGSYEEVDISGEWAVMTLHEGISSKLGVEVDPGTPLEELRELCRTHDIPFDPGWDADQVTLEMYEHLCEESTTMPTFYKDFPTGVSPLTRQKPSDPRVAERWDLVAFGAELGTAYTELTDPIEQRKRLTDQSLLAAAGDVEAMELDEDFLRALEYGMPPTGGQGMGIDRLVMFLTGKNIRETLLFPIVRPDQR
ncbi:MAG: bifunctional lysylphosphatidylglycerol synthetase/lysine--tRNA ligase LysX [Actinobacteria bacterium]|nr:bifunctional lysylphosphatidylglycerol synthetase/lysine--tRNA ligase LysX [Actinomycetota bacterium]MCB9413525.1 bifunctional lysylphosphatidylglycerol synthetase/lysine--tRNA ligase LysX [Actinomycetota bacterium]